MPTTLSGPVNAHYCNRYLDISIGEDGCHGVTDEAVMPVALRLFFTQLSALTALPKVLSSSPSNHMVAHTHP